MDPTLILFALGVLALVLVPYLPAAREWHRRLDATALYVAETYAETDGPDTADGYADGDVTTAPDASLAAVVAGGSLTLGPGTTVLRHAHAAEHLRVGAGCALHGSASAEGTVMLRAGTRFERVSGPALFLGAPHHAPPPPPVRTRFEPTARRDESGRYVIHGDLDVPDGALVGGTLVVTGSLRLGAGARVDGDARSSRDLVLGAGAAVGGHAVADGALALGVGAAVDGVAVARRRLTLAAHSRVGRHGARATATADHIRVAPGAIVYGTLWARIDGRVEDPAPDGVTPTPSSFEMPSAEGPGTVGQTPTPADSDMPPRQRTAPSEAG